MITEETFLEKVKFMPPNRKQQMLDFVEFLESKEANQEKVKESRFRSKRMGFREGLNYDKTSKLLEEIENADG